MFNPSSHRVKQLKLLVQCRPHWQLGKNEDTVKVSPPRTEIISSKKKTSIDADSLISIDTRLSHLKCYRKWETVNSYILPLSSVAILENKADRCTDNSSFRTVMNMERNFPLPLSLSGPRCFHAQRTAGDWGLFPKCLKSNIILILNIILFGLLLADSVIPCGRGWKLNPDQKESAFHLQLNSI